MKRVEYSKEKNILLRKKRGISFTRVTRAIGKGKLLAILDHPNQKSYPGQKLFIVNINNYAYVMPFVEDEEKIFLKTIFLSRKYTKLYLKRKESKYE